jgi:hypothetical protein
MDGGRIKLMWGGIAYNGRRPTTLRLASARRNVAEAEREKRGAKPEGHKDFKPERGPCLLAEGFSGAL